MPEGEAEAFRHVIGPRLAQYRAALVTRLDGGERVTITQPRRQGGPALRPGARVTLRWPPEAVRLLAPEA
jgi:hypothetical protein